MDTQLPDRWRALSALQRDVLVVLAQDGPAMGKTVNRELGRDAGLRGPVNRAIKTLREKGYVETETATGERGEAKHNQLSERGRELVAAVGKVWYECNVQVAP